MKSWKHPLLSVLATWSLLCAFLPQALWRCPMTGLLSATQNSCVVCRKHSCCKTKPAAPPTCCHLVVLPGQSPDAALPAIAALPAQKLTIHDSSPLPLDGLLPSSIKLALTPVAHGPPRAPVLLVSQPFHATLHGRAPPVS